MPRINYVKKCRKDQGRCSKCGDPLTRGSAYRWWKFRYGGKYKRCMKPECAPTRSDLTQSSNLATLYSIVDDADLSADTLGAISETARDIASGIRDDVAAVYRESAENIRSEFNYDNPTADECEEKADELEAFADEIESAGEEVDAMEDADVDDDGETEQPSEERLEEARELVRAALENCPL